MERYKTDKMRTHGQKSMQQKVGRSQSLRNYAYRRPDAETEEFVRFIRDFQVEKQPTQLRLQKQRAPLPEIGRGVNPGLRDSGFLDKTSDSDNDDVPLDNELILDNSKPLTNRRKNLQIYDVLSLARSQTRDSIFLNRTGPGLDNNFNGTKGISKKGTRAGNKTVSVQKNHNCTKQLPPLLLGDVPERPSAPSPSTTPPLPGKDAVYQEDEEEEPIDFIDPA